MVPSALNPFPLPRYGIAQLFITDETADPNRPSACYYAYVQKSTGLASEPNPENPNDPAIERYGPYIWPAATATAYDMSLILHRNRHFVGNFRPLARCVLAAIQRGIANGPPADPPLLVVYGSCLIDALAMYINSNYDQMLQFWRYIVETFLLAGQLLQKEFDEYWQRHLELLDFLREEVLQAYERNSWPNDVWPEFRSWVYSGQIVSSALPPTCFQVLIGAKAIEAHENVALPDKTVVEFRTRYAVDLCAVVEDQLGKLRVPPIFTDHILFIKMIVYVLGRHFDSKRDINIKPSHRPSLFARYAGHIADALIHCILHGQSNGGFQILEKAYPTVLQFSADDYFDGLRRSGRQHAMVEAFDEIVASYNNRQWPVEVWVNFLDEINSSSPNLLSGSLVRMYKDSCGGPRRQCTELGHLVLETEPWSNEDEAFEASGGGEIEADEEEERLDDCFKKTEECYNCLGPSSVTYTFRWLCKSDHTLEGLREETFGPFAVMSGDCASRIHDEVKKIFPFATAFPSVRRHPQSRAPNFVVGSCLHYENPQVVPMDYENCHWKPSEQGIPVDLKWRGKEILEFDYWISVVVCTYFSKLWKYRK